MKTFSVDTELRSIVSICDGGDAARTALLADLTEQHFAAAETSELWVRIHSFIQTDRPIPNTKVLRLDPALSDEAHDLLATKVEVAEDAEDAGSLVDQLELYRKLRVVYSGTRDVIDALREPSVKAIDTAVGALESIVVNARSKFDAAKIATVGMGTTAHGIINQLLDQKKPDRITTGFSQFDDASGGFARKDLVLGAATTGGGKSVMANQLAINAYLLGNRNTVIVSFEMDEEEVYARVLACLTGIPFHKIYLKRLSYKQLIRCRHAWQAFLRHGEENRCRFSVWCPTFEVTPEQAGAILKPGGYDIAFIDYVGLVDPGQKAALWENLGAITRGFKVMARNQNNVVVVMAQLDEETKQVKYAKAMRHHSSYVWTWAYGEEQEETNQIEIEMTKARHCRRFNFDLLADFSTMTIQDPRGESTVGIMTRLISKYVDDTHEEPEDDPEGVPAPAVAAPPPPGDEPVTYKTLLARQLDQLEPTEDEDCI